MDYYDGNTVTGLWNYAQHFAMSDNSYSDTFGPSTPGALNVTAANTYGGHLRADERRVRRYAVHGGSRDRCRDPGLAAASGHRDGVQRRGPELRHLLGDAGP